MYLMPLLRALRFEFYNSVWAEKNDDPTRLWKTLTRPTNVPRQYPHWMDGKTERRMD